MERMPSDMVLRELRKQYPLGMRVELVSMDDPQAPLPGTMGTVMDVDSLGTIHVRWDNGSMLGVVYGIDYAVKIIM